VNSQSSTTGAAPQAKPADRENEPNPPGSAMTGQGQLPQGAAASDTATLQGQIQQALQNETTLSNDKVTANVTDTEIELTGTVATGKDKQTAKRIAQSYAGNRKVVDHVKVTGKGKASDTNVGSPQPPL
jgi:hypothetical protein